MRILVIGAGSIGRRHISNLNLLGYNDLDVVDISYANLGYVKKNFKIKEIFTDFNDALNSKEYNVGFILTPPVYHIPMALELAKKGLDLFIEKPLSHNLENVDDLIKIMKANNLVIMMGFNMRFKSSLIKIKKLLEEEKIGKIISARIHVGSYLPYRHPDRDYREEYGAKKSLGGGVILDAIHQIDYALWFLGDVEEVFCYSGKMSNLEIEVEDNAEILLKFKNGALASLHLDYIQRPYQNKCELIGENGTIQWVLSLHYNVNDNDYSFRSEKVKLYDVKTGKWQIFNGDKSLNDAYIREVEYFISCVKLRKRPILDGEYGKKVLEVTLAAKKSSEIHNVVKVWE
jgi:predicted dehydrogenase